MRPLSSVFLAVLALPILAGTLLASGIRQANLEQRVVGDEPPPVVLSTGGVEAIPSPPRLMEVGTIVDSTIYDYQCNGAVGRRIVAIGDSALHVSCMVSPDAAFVTRGMKYIYYFGGSFTNFGYIEGNGTGNQRGGFGAVVGYYSPDAGLGNVAVACSHTNLDGRAFGSHWYSYQDAFQGLGAFSPFEGDPGDGSNVCEAFLWPTLSVVNDLTGSMAMTAMTGNQVCQSGADVIAVIHKDYNDASWGTAMLLDTMDDPSQWSGPGPDIPILEGADNGRVGVVTSEFGTNVYYWESTDAGVTWGTRENLTGYPITPYKVPPDTTSDVYLPLQAATVAMSPGGTPHAVWPAYQAEGVLPDSLYTPGVDAVYQYRTKLEHWDPIHGVTTVFRNPAGLANFVVTTQFAYNLGHPTIGFGPTDDIIYVVYEGYVNDDVDVTNGVNFGDIYVSMSTDGGATWEDRVNITNSLGSDDLYPAVSRVNPQGAYQELPGFSVGNPDGINDFVMIYQNDDVAGTWMRGDEPSANWDMLLVAPVDVMPATGIGDGKGTGGGASIPKAFSLGQNYPNPFNPSTAINFSLAERADVTLRIHNLRGQMVRELVKGTREAGTYSVHWDGRDSIGQQVASGVYLYVLETDKGFHSTKKMVVMK
jgi:hypothetical protein